MAHGADGSLHLLRIGDAAKDGGDVVAVLEGGGEMIALVGIVAKPVEEFGEAPLGGVNAAAPVDGFEFLAMSGVGDFGSFALGTVIAPEVIVVERIHGGVDGNDGGASG